MPHLLNAAPHSDLGIMLSDWAKMAAALLSILGGEEKETDPVIRYHPDNCISGLALKVYTVAANAVSHHWCNLETGKNIHLQTNVEKLVDARVV